MAANMITEGKVVPWTNPSTVDVSSGALVDIGAIAGVALVDIPAGETGNVAIEDVYEVASETDAAWTEIGTAVYFDGTSATLTVTGGTPLGRVYRAKATSAATAWVKLGPIS